MVCDIADLRCVYVNELIGSPVLAVILLGLLFFAVAAYKRIGLKTSLWAACVYFPIVSYAIAGTSFGFALATLVVAVSLALLHMRIIGNR